MEEIILEDGKYRFYVKDDVLLCERNGLVWREFLGDKAVHALFQECLEREETSVNKFKRLLSKCTKSQQEKFHKIFGDLDLNNVSKDTLYRAIDICERAVKSNESN